MLFLYVAISAPILHDGIIKGGIGIRMAPILALEDAVRLGL